MWARIYPWLLAIRLKTLTAAFVPILVATSLCAALGLEYHMWVSGYALLSAFCIQIATNLLNDAIDYKKGADTESRIGPQRVTQSGLLTEKRVFQLGLFFLVLAMLFAIPLVLRGGWPIVGLGLVSLFLAYGYTGGPFPLAYLGLGDLFVILFFGLFAVVGTAYLHCLDFHWAFVFAGLQVGFLSTILIAINNLRDSESDVKANKMTLAVRLGDTFVRIEILGLTLLTYLINLYYLVALGKMYPLITCSLLPLGGLVVGACFLITDKKQLNKVLALSALHQLLFSILLSLGLML
jgi:1,4-dihydroxy-2-naphthoate polyprenyltransferase